MVTIGIVDINNVHTLLISTIPIEHERNNNNCGYRQLILVIPTIGIVDINIARTLLVSVIRIVTINK